MTADAVRALMEADRWIERVVYQRDHLPEAQRLAEVETTLRQMAGELKTAEAALAPLEAAFTQAEAEAARLAERVSVLDRRLNADGVPAKELATIQTELEHVRDLRSQAEDREVEALLEVEPAREAVAAIREAAKPLMAERSVLQESIKALQATLDEEIASLRTARTQSATDVPADMLKRYEAALAHAGGAGAADLESGRCSGCRLTLAALDVDRATHQPEGTFADCPSCGRLLLP